MQKIDLLSNECLPCYKDHSSGNRIIKKIHLVAENSPKKAFYELWMEFISDGYLICKASGANGKILDRESWFRKSLDEAREKYQKILSDKLNPNRKSPRKYQLITS